MPARSLLRLLGHLSRHREDDASLVTLARRSGWSAFHLHRRFRAATGETPRSYVQRLRLERAAAQLLATRRRILDIALENGFAGPETFTRSFQRYFRRTPSRYRAEVAPSIPDTLRLEHARLAEHVGLCVRLFGRGGVLREEPVMREPSVTLETRPAQPVLFIRRRVSRADIAGALGECFGAVYMHCQKAGIPLAGPPTARYSMTGPGLLTIEAGMPVGLRAAAVADGIEAGELPAGPTAVAVHSGPYDALPRTHAAIERWIEEKGLKPAGGPWEAYVTDPAEHPDPADWRTEVCWPLAAADAAS